MIREGHKLPPDIETRIPALLDRITKEPGMVALYAFGSLASGNLKPLSDLDFGILISREFDTHERFDVYLDLIGTFTQELGIHEVDLVMMNDAPVQFSHNIVKCGNLIHCWDKAGLVDFIEKTNKLYLDFRFFRDAFDAAYLKGIGYNG
jgi:predicted nucleotidyltransferase